MIGKTIANAEDGAKNSSLYVDCREGSKYSSLKNESKITESA